MRHRKAGKRLGRTWEHRKAMFRNMTRSLLIYGRIRTTETKAKEMRKIADKLVNLSQTDDLHHRRLAYKFLGNHSLVKKLFDEIGPTFAGIPGGYTRVVRLGLPRPGDAATLAILELTHQAGEKPQAAKPKKKAAAKAAPAAPAVAEEAAPEEAAAPEAEAPEAAEASVAEEDSSADETPSEAAPEAAPETSEDEEKDK
jgi:large subunit ribosomal protein L17